MRDHEQLLGLEADIDRGAGVLENVTRPRPPLRLVRETDPRPPVTFVPLPTPARARFEVTFLACVVVLLGAGAVGISIAMGWLR